MATNQDTLRGVATISFWADDMEAATKWYSDLLGTQPYFERSGPDGSVAYVEFRFGDFQTELGIIDRRFALPTTTKGAGGATLYWAVDDVDATFDKLLTLGATELEPLTPGEAGFSRAAVVDPFGNILGIMHNPHYLEVVERIPHFDLPEIQPDMEPRPDTP